MESTESTEMGRSWLLKEVHRAMTVPGFLQARVLGGQLRWFPPTPQADHPYSSRRPCPWAQSGKDLDLVPLQPTNAALATPSLRGRLLPLCNESPVLI